MVVVSGAPPYNYGVRLPIRSGLDCSAIGMSGALLEAAMFVVQAERRKWDLFVDPGDVHGDYNVYVNDNIAPSGPFEPKADGSTLANQLNPGIIEINNLKEVRAELYEMFGFSASDSIYTTDEHLTDWIRQTYPDSPSGYYPTGATTTRGIFLRPQLGAPILPGDSDAGAITGPIVDTDVHWLGSSGVIYDIDIGEVMYNPYPQWRRDSTSLNAHGGDGAGSVFRIEQAPLFPRFQKIDGSIISATTQDLLAYSFNVSQPTDMSIDHVVSGHIRCDGYALRDGTDILLGLGETNFSNVTDFTHIVDGLRPIIGGRTEESSRIFVTPTAQSSGVYRICGRNNRVNFPETAVVSGVVSQWPKTTQSSTLGYEVFDECLWLTDVPKSSVLFTDGPPSGLAVLSPFSFDYLWLRHAEVNDNNVPWDEHVGLERRTADRIERVEDTPFVHVPADGLADYVVTRYNDLLEFTSTTSFAMSAFTITGMTDMMYDGTNYYFLAGTASGPSVIWRTTGGFVETATQGPPAASGIFGSPQALRASNVNGQNVLYNLAGWHSIDNGKSIIPFTLVAGSPDVLTFGVPKPLIHASSSVTIHDIVEISGSTELEDGVWAIITTSTSSLLLVRIEEESYGWEIVFSVSLPGGGTFVNNGNRQMVLMPVS